MSQSETWNRRAWLSAALNEACEGESIEDAPDPLPTTEGMLAAALKLANGNPYMELHVLCACAVVGELAAIRELLGAGDA